MPIRRNKPINAGVPRRKKEPRRAQQQRPGGRKQQPGGRGGEGQGSGRDYLKRKRKEQARVTEPLTPKGVRQQTRAATNLRFRPLEREIGAEIRASNRRTGEVGDWWQNYLAQVDAGRAETQAAYAQAGQELSGQTAQASQIDSANTQRLQEEATKSAELRGAPVDTSAAQRETAAQAQRNYLANAFGGAVAREGANQFAYLTDQKRIGLGQSIASRKEEQRRTRSLEQDRRATRRERGDYATTKRQELRDKERDYLIQRSAFNLDKKEGAREARENAGDRAYDRRQDRIGNRQAQERIGVSREGNRRDKGGRTPEDRREAREGRQGAYAAAQSLYRAAKKPPRTPREWAAFESLLRAEEEISPAEARAAVNRLRKQVRNRKPSRPQGKTPGEGIVIPGDQIVEG